jgi:hypothetical protein
MWWVIPLLLLASLGAAIMPVFYFALYRDKGAMWFPASLRKLALAGAMTLAIVMVAGFQAWPATLNWSYAFGLLANLTYVLLLVAISREAREQPSEQMPVAEFLRVVTQVAVLGWGIWVAFQLVRIPGVILTYPSLKTYAYQVGRTPPPLLGMVRDVTLTFFSQASLLAAPYIVWRSYYGRPRQRQSL